MGIAPSQQPIIAPAEGYAIARSTGVLILRRNSAEFKLLKLCNIREFGKESGPRHSDNHGLRVRG